MTGTVTQSRYLRPNEHLNIPSNRTTFRHDGGPHCADGLLARQAESAGEFSKILKQLKFSIEW